MTATDGRSPRALTREESLERRFQKTQFAPPLDDDENEDNE